ncbi:MAG: hypothetical protein J0H01_37270 [Rhizobiales bacterium]|nr:hypothetical protein [Hyphomicrobiales bacterium]
MRNFVIMAGLAAGLAGCTHRETDPRASLPYPNPRNQQEMCANLLSTYADPHQPAHMRRVLLLTMRSRGCL